MKILNTLLVALLFSLNCGGQDTVFSSYDKDGDSHLSLDEFAYMLSDQGFFEHWDKDMNGYISLIEWYEAMEVFYPDCSAREYTLYENWDMNSRQFLQEKEFEVGNFTLWDTNLDQKIDEQEWARYYYQWIDYKVPNISSAAGAE